MNDREQSGPADRIFMIGFMGCGKTTWARKLAAKLAYEFVDLDQLLEEKAGMSIADYFSSFGEAKFREMESEVLKETRYPLQAVIATGGGLPCFFDHMDWMNANGKSLYIQLSPKTLADRLENARVKRPLLQGKHGEELINFIAEKLAEREAHYLRASHIINGIDLTVEKFEETLR